MIHYSRNDDRTACALWAGQVFEYSSDWTKVTCADCRLERPMEPGRDDYFTKGCGREQLSLRQVAQAREQLEFLASLRQVAQAQRRLGQAKINEQSVLSILTYWARKLAEAVSDREAAERGLGVAQEGSTISGRENGSQRVAPVNAVDLRPPRLSLDAEASLIEADPEPLSAVLASAESRSELFTAGLITRSGRLTPLGAIRRQRLVDARLDDAFGPA